MPAITHLLRRWALPPERDFGWKMKPLESATTRFAKDDDGVLHLTIEHDIVRGVTPGMLLWWFQHIGGDMAYKGKTYPRYLVWHPKDHIHWSLAKGRADGSVGTGSYFRIVEAFGRDMRSLVDSTERVEKLDETGIRLVKRIGTTEVFSLQHDFIPHGPDTLYRSHMRVGTSRRPFNRVFNPWIRPLLFTEAMAHAWLKHNVEEVRNFEFFLPELYESGMREGDESAVGRLCVEQVARPPAVVLTPCESLGRSTTVSRTMVGTGQSSS